MNSHLSFKHLHIDNLSEVTNQDEINHIEDHSSSLSSKEKINNDIKVNFQITKSFIQIDATKKASSSTYHKAFTQPIFSNVQNNKSSNSPNSISKMDKKLKENIISMINIKKTSSLYHLKNIRNCALKWLKEGENGEVDYNKFITEKKIKYLLKHLETTNSKLKIINFELEQHKHKLEEVNLQLGDLFINYDYKELKDDIQREDTSYDVKVAKKERVIEQLEVKKNKLPFVKIQSQLKYVIELKSIEKTNLQKNMNCTKNNLKAIVNYFKNIK